MAKLRIFVSSTYYDLKHVRAGLESFIKTFDYQPVHFERNDITFAHNRALDISCFKELEFCDMQILIIGGVYGSAISEEHVTQEQKKDPYFEYKSVTRGEFEIAIGQNIPVYIFVEDNVHSEYKTFTKNRANKTINYAHGNPNTFQFLDYIYSLPKNNYVQRFSEIEDIMRVLRAQWSNLFQELLQTEKTRVTLENLNTNLKILSRITDNMKDYSEAILNHLDKSRFEELKKEDVALNDEILKLKATESELFRYIARNTLSSDQKILEIISKKQSFDQFIEELLIEDDLDMLGVNDDKKMILFRLFKDFKFQNFGASTYQVRLEYREDVELRLDIESHDLSSSIVQGIVRQASLSEDILFLSAKLDREVLIVELKAFKDKDVENFIEFINKKFNLVQVN